MINEFLNLKIITLSEILVDTRVHLASMETENGAIGIMVNHMPLVASLKQGGSILTYQDSSNNEVSIFVHDGIMTTDGVNLEIIVDFALEINQDNIKNIKNKLADLQKKLTINSKNSQSNNNINGNINHDNTHLIQQQKIDLYQKYLDI